MPKVIKGNAGRTPPKPSTDHFDIEEWWQHLMPDLQPIVQRLDEVIRATVPDLEYAVSRKRGYYGVPELGWIIEIAAYAVSVNVLFLGGAEFRVATPARNDRPNSVHQDRQPGGGPDTGAAAVDRTGGPHARMEMTGVELPIAERQERASQNVLRRRSMNCREIRATPLPRRGIEYVHLGSGLARRVW